MVIKMFFIKGIVVNKAGLPTGYKGKTATSVKLLLSVKAGKFEAVFVYKMHQILSFSTLRNSEKHLKIENHTTNDPSLNCTANTLLITRERQKV